MPTPTDPGVGSTFDPPPIPDDFPPETKFQLRMHVWSTRLIVREAQTRHEELLSAIRGPAKEPGIINGVVDRVSKNPAAQMGLVSMLSGLTTTAMGAVIYAIFYLYGIPATPTPVPVRHVDTTGGASSQGASTDTPKTGG